jgi:hypothetical protein
MRLFMTAVCVSLFASTAAAQGLLQTVDGEGAGDVFGRAMDFIGDLNGDNVDDIVVGARDADGPNGVDSGRAYVYSGKHGTLLCVMDGEAVNDGFGISVAGLGDLNGDQILEWIVGARDNDSGGQDSGRAYVYSGCSATPMYTFTGLPGARLGWSAKSAGDANNDGTPDIVVGAPGFANSGDGRAYVYSGVDGSLLQTYQAESIGDMFGASTTGVGDMDADGYDDLLVGAAFHAANGPKSGRAYIYSGQTGGLMYMFTGEFQEWLGSSVSPGGDINGDGYDDVQIAAVFAGDNYEGRVVVYSGLDGSVLYSFKGEGPLDQFGYAMARTGDVNGDGYDDMLIGACDATSGNKRGRTYLYSGCDGTLLSLLEGEFDEDRFGIAVAGSGDANNDLRADFMVGAYNHDTAGLDSGRVYIYRGDNLYLAVDPDPAPVNATVDFNTVGGPAGQPAMLFLVAVNSSPIFISVANATLDSCGNWMMSANRGSTFSGTQVTLQAFSLDGAGGIAQSEPQTLTLE